MTTPLHELPDAPTGTVPKRPLIIGISFLLGVIGLVLIAGMNSCRSDAKPTGQTVVARPDSVVAQPPRVPQPRPEPASVDATRPSLARAEATRPMEASAPAVDPLVTERRKRDFESRYASSVVVSFRPEDSGRHAAAPTGATSTDRRLPSTDEVVDKVIKAYSVANGGSTLSLPGMSTPPGVRPTPERPDSRGNGPTAPETTPPIDDSGPTHRVLESSIIDAVLVNRLNGDNASPIVGKVTNPLYSHNGDYVLIPADTKIVGETKAVQQFGETRLVVLFHRLIFPDGSTKSLDQFKGLNGSGEVGLRDQVNHHYLSTFGAAAAISVVTGAGQALGNRGLGGRNGTTVIAGNAGDGAGQATSQVLNRFLNRLPTITIQEGARFKVYVTDDIELPAYPSTR